MTERELIALLESEIDNALGTYSSEIASERAQAMDAYLQQPYGNEQEGRSQVVTSEVMDTVEWTMPQLMRIFTSTDKIVEFEPVGPEDEKAAELETQVVNHVFFKQNNGYQILYTLFKDALIQKNGFVRTYFDESEKVTTETYTGLTEIQLNLLLNDPEAEAVKYSENVEEIQTPDGEVIEMLTYDVELKRVTKRGKVVVENMPPEDVYVSRDTNCPDIKKSPFVCHARILKASELVEMGYSRKLVDTLDTYEQNNTTEEELARNSLSDETFGTYTSNDKALRNIEVHDCFLNVDFDDDGIAELRFIRKVGDKILENEQIDTHGISSGTPIPIPHKFYGLSLFDLVGETQLINSTVLRQILDNLFLSNNVRIAAQSGKVNLDDLLSSKPGGVVRTNEPPSNVVMPLVTPPILDAGLRFLEYSEKLKERKTGIGDSYAGLDADVLKGANIPMVTGVQANVMQRVEMIAKNLAEAVKSMMRDIHTELRHNQDIPLVLKLSGEWVEVDPRTWRDRSDMSISVGLGTGSKVQQLAAIQSLIDDQMMLMELGSPMVDELKLFNGLKRKAEAIGYANELEWFNDPRLIEPQPEQPDPTIELLKQQLQLQAEQNQIAMQKQELEYQEKLMKMENDREKLLLEERRKLTELELKYDENVPGSMV